MKGYIWIASAAIVLVVMIFIQQFGCNLFADFPGCPDIGSEPPSAGKAASGIPETPAETVIQISMASSSTKKQWLDQAVESFNTSSSLERGLQLGGKPIEVEIILEETSPGKWDHYRSGSMITDILDEKIEPTIASPADKSWLLKLNKDWRDYHGQHITSTDAVGLVRTPFVMAMWESRRMFKLP